MRKLKIILLIIGLMSMTTSCKSSDPFPCELGSITHCGYAR